VSLRDTGPDGDAAYVDGCKEGGGILGVTSGNTSPSFDVKEGILDEVPQATF
jgi:GTPase